MGKSKEGVIDSSRLAWDTLGFSTEGPSLSENPPVPGKPGGLVTLNKVFQEGQRASDEVSLEWFLGVAEVESFLILGFGFWLPPQPCRGVSLGFPDTKLGQKGKETIVS